MKHVFAATATLAAALTLTACSSEPPLNENSTKEEIHSYLGSNGADIREANVHEWLKNVCTLLEHEDGNDAAADVQEAVSGASVQQARNLVGAAVLTKCPAREYKLDDSVDWW